MASGIRPWPLALRLPSRRSTQLLAPSSAASRSQRTEASRRAMTHPRYRTAAWRAVRKQVLARDGRLCQIKRPGCTVIATEVDHRVRPEAGGAEYDPANLRAACKACNVGKRNAELAARAAGR